MRIETKITPPGGHDVQRAADFANVEIARGLQTLAMEMERRVKLLTPVGVLGEAGLRGSIHGEVRGTPARTAVIGTSIVYGAVVEHGRRPHQARPPIAPLELWVRRKLGVPADRARGVAFAVAWKIARKGFKGAKMFQRAHDEGLGLVRRIWDQVGERIAARLSGNPMG